MNARRWLAHAWLGLPLLTLALLFWPTDKFYVDLRWPLQVRIALGALYVAGSVAAFASVRDAGDLTRGRRVALWLGAVCTWALGSIALCGGIGSIPDAGVAQAGDRFAWVQEWYTSAPYDVPCDVTACWCGWVGCDCARSEELSCQRRSGGPPAPEILQATDDFVRARYDGTEVLVERPR